MIGSRGEVDLKGNDKVAGLREHELVDRGSYIVCSVGESGGSGGRNGARGHLVSVDLGSMDVLHEAIGVLEGGVDGGNRSTISESASETVVASCRGEGGEASSDGSGPAVVAKGGLGPVVGCLRSIGVLPLREGS